MSRGKRRYTTFGVDRWAGTGDISDNFVTCEINLGISPFLVGEKVIAGMPVTMSIQNQENIVASPFAPRKKLLKLYCRPYEAPGGFVTSRLPRGAEIFLHPAAILLNENSLLFRDLVIEKSYEMQAPSGFASGS